MKSLCRENGINFTIHSADKKEKPSHGTGNENEPDSHRIGVLDLSEY